MGMTDGVLDLLVHVQELVSKSGTKRDAFEQAQINLEDAGIDVSEFADSDEPGEKMYEQFLSEAVARSTGSKQRRVRSYTSTRWASFLRSVSSLYVRTPFMCMHACVRACVCVCARACVYR